MAQDYMGNVGQEGRSGQESRQSGTYEDTKSAIKSAVDKTQKAVQTECERRS